VRRYILSPKVDTTQVVEWLMAVKVDLPMMGPNVAMCDLARLRQFQPDLLNVKATSPSEVDHWLFKRPDHRVVERIRLKYYESERL
jgi:hypothetical protein